jgi:hypothetical protein
MTIIKVSVNNVERKKEYSQYDKGFSELLEAVTSSFDIQGNIFGISHDGGSKYGIYLGGKPTVSPVDLTGIETDPLTNDLISFKIDLADNSIKAKVYYIGNINNVVFDKHIAGTGVYVGEDTFTVYYQESLDQYFKNLDVKDSEIQQTFVLQGFSATTFYADGTTSDASVYTQENE